MNHLWPTQFLHRKAHYYYILIENEVLSQTLTTMLLIVVAIFKDFIDLFRKSALIINDRGDSVDL